MHLMIRLNLKAIDRNNNQNTMGKVYMQTRDKISALGGVRN